jgi:AcrR family transcriptional regulator
MTGKQRREQLLDIGRALFAERGFDGTSIEEIASQAGVSKPVVYEHFRSKEGLYAVVVDREMEQLLDSITTALESETHPRVVLERAALALLDYIEMSTDGFRILVRDSPVAQSTGGFASLISDAASQVEHDGRKYQVNIPALSVPRCSNCGELIIDPAADKQIEKMTERSHRIDT